MKAHLQAVEAALASLGLPTSRWYSARLQEGLILSVPTAGSDSDLPVCGTSEAFEVPLRLKAVAFTPDGPGVMLNRARTLLAGPIPMEGRHVTLTWLRAEFVDVDTSVMIPDTDTHPFVGVETYQLTSQPKE